MTTSKEAGRSTTRVLATVRAVCGQPHGDRGKPGTRLERHGRTPQGVRREGARAEHSGRCAETRCQPAPGTWETSGSLRQRRTSGEGLGRGNPRELVHAGSDVAHVELRIGRTPRGRGTWCFSSNAGSPRTNGEEVGSLVTGNPLVRRRASKGKDASEEGRAQAKVCDRPETRRTL